MAQGLKRKAGIGAVTLLSASVLLLGGESGACRWPGQVCRFVQYLSQTGCADEPMSLTERVIYSYIMAAHESAGVQQRSAPPQNNI